VSECPVCDGSCSPKALAQLRVPELSWLWSALAEAGDRRGDRRLTAGAGVRVVVPEQADWRAAAGSLLGARPLVEGRSRTVKLVELTAQLHRLHPNLTPGALAAHDRGSPLALRHDQRRVRADGEGSVLEMLVQALGAERGQRVWDGLRRSGRVPALLAADTDRVLRQLVAVLGALPVAPARTDRRSLAQLHGGGPHALDPGALLPALVRAAAVGLGLVEAGLQVRACWESLGVDLDDVVGGLAVLGVVPAGWVVPAGSVLTLPPRELADPVWPDPPGVGAVVFVTENPSVLTAVADRVRGGTAAGTSSGAVRVVCTMGTPSAREVMALDALARRGWVLRVRADFDEAGLRHVGVLLGGVSGAVPWRMGACDYLEAVGGVSDDDRLGADVPPTPWCAALRGAMVADGRRAYEEALLSELVDDVAGVG
jgi:uncharacterized protein (TIGR02679 family)